MAGIHDPSRVRQPSGSERHRERAHSRVLADHVARAAAQREIGDPFNSVQRGRAERADGLLDAATCVDPIGVARSGELASGTGDHDDFGFVGGWKRDRHDGVGGAVEEQGVVDDAVNRGQLVE